jgi:transposase
LRNLFIFLDKINGEACGNVKVQCKNGIKLFRSDYLALKMSMKGMSIEGIADVLEVESASVKRWLARAAEQCDKVNDTLMKNVEVSKVEMDELWVIIQKK